MNCANLFLFLYDYGGEGFGKALGEWSTPKDLAALGMTASAFNTDINLGPIGIHVRNLDLESVAFAQEMNNHSTKRFLENSSHWGKLTKENTLWLSRRGWVDMEKQPPYQKERTILYKDSYRHIIELRYFANFEPRFFNCEYSERFIMFRLKPIKQEGTDILSPAVFITIIDSSDWDKGPNMEKEFLSREKAEAYMQKMLDLRIQQYEAGPLAPFLDFEKKVLIALPIHETFKEEHR